MEGIDTTRTIKRPIELASFAGQLTRAEKPETELAATGQRYDRGLAELCSSLSIVPTDLDCSVYRVVEDFGARGYAWRETDQT